MSQKYHTCRIIKNIKLNKYQRIHRSFTHIQNIIIYYNKIVFTFVYRCKQVMDTGCYFTHC